MPRKKKINYIYAVGRRRSASARIRLFKGKDQSLVNDKPIEEYFPGDNKSLMFGGHRPVKDKFKARANGRYLQIHNPDEFIAVYIKKMSEFSTDRNILILPKFGEVRKHG